jgi:triacylglycerol esterase/lipase EstA (alpha/beta hydrolase family)
MLYHGFEYHRTSIIRFPTVFPLRPLTLFTTKRSPVKILSYWLRPHTSKTKLPIVFLHGIGIGLWTYVDFLAALNNQGNDDGEIGIIAIEILPVSFRITHSALDKEVMCRQIKNILLHHGFENFVLVTHSCVLLTCLEIGANL